MVSELESHIIQERKTLYFANLSDLPVMPHRHTLVKVPSGEIRMELGADGSYLQFDCDCLDALPYCQAQCCALRGTGVSEEELERVVYPVDWDSECGFPVLKRDADGFCTCLDRNTRRCGIYEDRPQTCKSFHCTRGVGMRGWKLANSVHRQSAG